MPACRVFIFELLYSCLLFQHPLTGLIECSRGTQLEGYVITSLVQLLCRTTKLCWFDDDHFRIIVEDAKAFLAKGTGGSPVSSMSQ